MRDFARARQTASRSTKDALPTRVRVRVWALAPRRRISRRFGFSGVQRRAWQRL